MQWQNMDVHKFKNKNYNKQNLQNIHLMKMKVYIRYYSQGYIYYTVDADFFARTIFLLISRFRL